MHCSCPMNSAPSAEKKKKKSVCVKTQTQSKQSLNYPKLSFN